MAKKKTKIEYKCYTEKGERFMICRNSEEDKSYWAWSLLKDLPRCFNWNKVGTDVSATLCYSCVNKITEQPKIAPRYKPTGRPPGWQWMSEFVDSDGTVYHKGKEQPKLKGTIKPTKIVSKKKKKKPTKREREKIKGTDMSNLYDLKKKLAKAKLKKDKKPIQTAINKIQRKYFPTKKKTTKKIKK